MLKFVFRVKYYPFCKYLMESFKLHTIDVVFYIDELILKIIVSFILSKWVKDLISEWYDK